MVISGPEAKDVILVKLASIVLDLVVGLHGRLRGKEVDAGAERIQTSRETELVAADGQLNPRRRIEDAGSGYRVFDPVLKLGIAETYAVS